VHDVDHARRDPLLATGNVKDFEATGIDVIDPWHAA